MSMVRLALVTSVTCRPPSGPPVSHQISQVSIFPNRAWPRSAASRTPGVWSRIHLILPPEKYEARGRPYLLPISLPVPFRQGPRQISSVRVSCQTMARPYGSPVAGFQTTVVSR